MSGDAPRPLGLVGGVGLTEVHVYAQRPAPDGTFSGCPHVHAVADEAYYVLRGSGRAEFHDLARGFRTVPLGVGDYVGFPPRVLHRLVSAGDLVVLAVMGSAGLAERGEARVYFGADVDADAGRFDELVSLPKRGGLDGALERRDWAVRAYTRLMDLWRDDRAAYYAELRRFVDVHARAMARRADEFAEQVRAGPRASAEATLRRLEALPAGEDGGAVVMNRAGRESALGMCGVLRPMLALARVAP